MGIKRFIASKRGAPLPQRGLHKCCWLRLWIVLGYGCPAYSNYWVPYGTSSAAPYGIYASSYAIACERLKSGYAAPYGPIFY